MARFTDRIRSSRSYKWLVLAVIMIGTFMAVLDITVVNVGIPTIMGVFHTTISTAEWVITAYMITMTVMLPSAGWIADRWGNKRIYLLGMVLFTLGSWLCGRSSTDMFLIASRALQGIGGGIIQALGLAIVSREFTPQQRPVALGLWSVAAAASISFGPLLGGFLVDDYSWHLIFDINVPIGILGIAATAVIQREWKRPDIGRFDYWGFILVAIFMPLLVYGLARGNSTGNPRGWSAPEVIGSFAIGGLALAAFIVVELKIRNPLLNIRLLGERNFGISNMVLAIFGMGMFGGTYLLPLFMQKGLDYTAIMAGSVFLPVGLIQGVLALSSGFIVKRTGALPPVFAGLLIMAASFWLASRFTAGTTHHQIMVVLYLRGFGMGLVFAPLNVFALKHLAQRDMADAAGISNSIKQIFGSLSVALLTTILTAREGIHQAQGVADSRSAFIDGITDDFRLVSILMVVSLAPFLLLLRKRRTCADGYRCGRGTPSAAGNTAPPVSSGTDEDGNAAE